MEPASPTGGRSREDKGIPEGGRRGRLHNWKIFTQKSRFQAIFKISEDLATRSLHIPMATPAGAERPLPPSDWTCALRVSADPPPAVATSGPPYPSDHLVPWALRSVPGLKTVGAQKTVLRTKGLWHMSHQPAAKERQPGVPPPPRVLRAVFQCAGASRST